MEFTSKLTSKGKGEVEAKMGQEEVEESDRHRR